jgi:hypothetical protein
MRFKEGVGVQRKLECHTSWAFEGILGMAGGMGLAFVFGMMFGAKKQLSSLHSQNYII